MRLIILLALVLALAACSTGPTYAPVEPAAELEAGQQLMTFNYEGEERAYMLYVPPTYMENWQEPWPTVLFLHGSGERGSNPRRLTGVPPLDAITLGERDYPFILIAPHLSTGEDWFDEAAFAKAALDDATTRVSVNADNIAVTGFSLGGRGVWAFAEAYPDLAARLAPVAGFWQFDGSPPDTLCTHVERPVWLHHSTDDEAVPALASQRMVEAAKEDCGAEVIYTEYTDLNHSQTAQTVYADDAFITWLAGE